jgi:hypothetical protein
MMMMVCKQQQVTRDPMHGGSMNPVCVSTLSYSLYVLLGAYRSAIAKRQRNKVVRRVTYIPQLFPRLSNVYLQICRYIHRTKGSCHRIHPAHCSDCRLSPILPYPTEGGTGFDPISKYDKHKCREQFFEYAIYARASHGARTAVLLFC